MTVDHLAGWTVAVTADRRADEQAELLQRRGADVVLAPLVEAGPVGEAASLAATRALLAAPVDRFIGVSAVGMRSWMAMAWTWDLGTTLLDALRRTTIVARGPKVAGVLVGEGLEVDWASSADTLAELLEHLPGDLHGKRIGVLLPGSDTSWFLDELRSRAADVVPVPVYEVVPTSASAPRTRLAEAAARGGLDAVSFTSPAAVEAAAGIPGLIDDLARTGVACACVGPVTASAARRAGLQHIVTADPHRLGSMVRSLGEHLAERGHVLEVGPTRVRIQGARVEVDGTEAKLTPRERRLLDAMLATPGAVLSKERLTALAWDERVDEHTVEVAVNRLRRKLGPAASALETTNRRGYRMAI
ncbi:MAG: uroporphyrinogen-III synthase [Actinomycetota bacterium]|nr:uroporphyrinogen-III synthase [Actinomycetota bacterium]